MDIFTDGAREAWSLLTRGDPVTWHAIWLSVWTSVLSVALAAPLAVPLGAWIGLSKPRSQYTWVFLFRLGVGVPTVALGLFLYGLFSRRGPLGDLGFLYTPQAIVTGEVLLAFPILASLSHAAAAHLDPRVLETVRTHGGGRLLAVRLMISETRAALVAAFLLAFGRCLTELGVAIIVGGGYELRTRTLPAQVSLEISKGEFGKAAAACLVLVVLAFGAVIVAWSLGQERKR
jgi:tungstate transport system permease protein